MLKKLFIAVTAGAALMAMPAPAVGQTVCFNCDVWYEDVSNTVYGYNETYTDYTFDFYYEAQVSAQLYEDGQYVDGAIVVTSGSYARAEVSAPAQPNTEYFLNGGTYAIMYYYQYIVPYYYYYDFGNFSYLIQNDPCYGLLFRVCVAPGPPIWIPMVAGAGIGGVWDVLVTSCPVPTDDVSRFDVWGLSEDDYGRTVYAGFFKAQVMDGSKPPAPGKYAARIVTEWFSEQHDYCYEQFQGPIYLSLPSHSKDAVLTRVSELRSNLSMPKERECPIDAHLRSMDTSAEMYILTPK